MPQKPDKAHLVLVLLDTISTCMNRNKNGLDNLQLDSGLNYKENDKRIILVGTHGDLNGLKIAPAGG